ncbi:MAG: hypothetical protein QWI73_06835 [Alphaproteobacteria bacterium]|nr:hypothetical protein [Alphaproteobacteria bacterium]
MNGKIVTVIQLLIATMLLLVLLMFFVSTELCELPETAAAVDRVRKMALAIAVMASSIARLLSQQQQLI